MCVALLVAAHANVLAADRMTLRWMHTVEKTLWEEDYRTDGRLLVIEEARVRSSGAGMDPPATAVWSAGWWRYEPRLAALEEVTLANSPFSTGYTVCWKGTCQPLSVLVPPGEPVRLASRPCVT